MASRYQQAHRRAIYRDAAFAIFILAAYCYALGLAGAATT